MKITNDTKHTILSDNVLVADTFLTRFKGLVGRKSLDPGEALLIKQCNSIHMFFMKFPIDVIFVDGDFKVVGLVGDIRPFHVSPVFFKARHVVEAEVGTIEKSQTSVGDILRLE